MLSPDEIAANPIGTDLIYEDERIRVWRIELAPGEVAGFHTHMLDYTTVVVDGDRSSGRTPTAPSTRSRSSPAS